MPETNPVTQAQQAEQALRSDLESTLVVLRTLKPHCTSVDDLIDVLEFALMNDTQLRFLWSKFVQKT